MLSNKIIYLFTFIASLSIGFSLQAETSASIESHFPVDSSYTDPHIYSADLDYGWIGASELGERDAPHDNIFKIDVDQDLSADARVWIEYDVYGVSDGNSVGLIVNDNTAYGGYLVETNQEWISHKEEISKHWLHRGTNRLQFTKLSELDYDYQIKNLRLVIDEAQNANEVVMTSSYSAETGNTYVRGLILDASIEKVFHEGQEVPIRTNTFELYYANKNEVSEATVVLVDNMGNKKSTTIEINKLQREAMAASHLQLAETYDYSLDKGSEFLIDQVLFGFELPADVLQHDLSLELTKLRPVDLPPMDNYLTNVTKKTSGYRLLPHGQHFSEEGAILKMAFDKDQIPRGYTIDDIQTFFFDIENSSWRPLHRDSIDLKNGIIYSRVQHFTDYINGVLAAPESPTTSNYSQTDFEDLINGNPAAEVGLIKPPSASQTGEASLSYPLKVPPGRNGLQPNLALTYSSDGGSSWVGYGWNLSVPSIEIETRWGAPRYDGAEESEAYLLSGQQLVLTENGRNYLPHRDDWIPRQTGEVEFFTRSQSSGGFEEITRFGNSPEDYYWTVTDRNGMTYHYGGVGAQNVAYVIKTDVLNQSNGDVAKWLLARVEDTYGNFINYQYQKEAVNIGNDVMAISCYLEFITYTHHPNLAGIYSVGFDSDPDRIDSRLDARSGVLMLDNRQLNFIDVVSNSDGLVRRYELEKDMGAFQKELLLNIICLGSDLVEFYRHSINYNPLDGSYEPNAIWDSGNNTPEADLGLVVDILDAAGTADSEVNFSPLGGNQTEGNGFSMYVGAGIGCDPTKGQSVGASFGFQDTNSSGQVSFTDIDGDGLPDKVYRTDMGIAYARNRARTEALTGFECFNSAKDLESTFSPSLTLTTNGNYDFRRSIDNSTDFGINGYWMSANVGVGQNRSRSSMTSFLSDVNGDGYVDIVDNGIVNFNENGVFTQDVTGLDCPLLPSQNAVTFNLFSDEESDEYAQINPPLDIVRVWRAPRAGEITITGSEVTFTENSLDGVIVYIQHSRVDAGGQQINVNQFDSGALSTNNITVPPQTYSVQEGDRIFFRASSVTSLCDNGERDEVVWDTEIRYMMPVNELDATGNDSDIYSFANDMLESYNNDFVPPLDGTLQFNGTLTTGDLTDQVRLEFWEVGVGILAGPFILGGNASLPITFTRNVTEGTNYQIRLVSNSQINWENVQLVQRSATLTPTNGGDPIMYNDNAIPYNINHYQEIIDGSNIDFEITKLTNAIAYPVGKSSSISVSIIDPAIVADAIANQTNRFFISIKDDNQTYFQEEFEVSGVGIANVTALNSIPIDVFVPQGTSNLYCTITANNLELFTEGLDLSTSIVGLFNSTSLLQSFFPTFHVLDIGNQVNFNGYYRGWGVFAYNPNHGTNNNVCSTNVDYSEISLDAIDNPVLDPATVIEDQPDPGFEIFEVALWPVTLSQENGVRWAASDNSTFSTRMTMKPSRLGSDNVDGSVTTNVGGNSYSGVPIVSCGSTTSLMGGAGIGSITFLSEGDSNTKLDYLDLNGDRIPDVIENGDNQAIYYTFPRGDIDQQTPTMIGGASSSSNLTFPFGLSFNGSFVHTMLSRNSNEGSKSAVRLGPGFGFSSNETSSDQMWIDINGDGLSDAVTYMGGMVRVHYNLGYSFSDAVVIDINREIQRSESTTTSFSLGLSLFDGSISAGFSYTKTVGDGRSAFVDLNGDGLQDFIFQDGNQLSYLLNDGLEFIQGVDLNVGGLGVEHPNRSLINGSSTNGGITIPICILGAKIVLSQNITDMNSMNRTEATFQDIDGDGYVDFLTSGETGYLQNYDSNEIHVRRSPIGVTNKVSSVSSSIGGSCDITYSLSPATVDHPNGKYVMKSLTIDDGFAENGPPMSYTFEYANGFYDRCERKFLGFENVNTTEFESGGNRTTANTFMNDDVYRQGLLVSSTLHAGDRNGTIWRSSTNEYDSNLVIPSQNNNHIEGAIVNDFDGLETEVVFTGLQMTETRLPINGSIGEQMFFDYDGRGNVVWHFYGNGTQPFAVDLMYDNSAGVLNNNLLGLATSLDIPGLRNRQASYFDTGKINQSTVAGSETAITNFTYDAFGNIRTVILPNSGGRKQMTFTYETTAQTHLATVVDNAFGYTSSFPSYDYRFGKPTMTTDINGKSFTFQYDRHGRLFDFDFSGFSMGGTILYNLGFGQMTFGPGNPILAETQRDDPQFPGNPLRSVNFSDGLGRLLQSAAEAEINGMPSSVYSGVTSYDALGRVEQVTYPVNGGGNLTYNSAGGLPTTTTYDILNRKTSTSRPGNRNEAWQYFGSNPFLTTIYTDPNGNSSSTRSEFNGPIERQVSNMGFTTTFDYDAINQLRLVTHPNPGQSSTYDYDMAGNRILSATPDKTTSYDYDGLNNMIQSSDGEWTIDYMYEFGRLTDVMFDQTPDMNVSYTYDGGGCGLGRIATMSDITGTQSFTYDPLGEVIQIDRSIAIPYKIDALEFTTSFVYDIWGRIQNMTYPDGEVLDYGYDEGGALNSISGAKSGNDYTYVAEINYDEFGDRILMDYGNQHIVTYSYHPDERWYSLVNHAFSTGNIEVRTQDPNVNYDNLGNVLSVECFSGAMPEGIYGNGTQSYSYDSDYRLLSGTGNLVGSEFCPDQFKEYNYTHTYTYDDMGNINTKVSTSDRLDETYRLGYSQGYSLFYNEGAGYPTNNQINTIREVYNDGDGYNTVDREADHSFSYNANGSTESHNQTLEDTQNSEKLIETTSDRALVWRDGDVLGASADKNAITHYIYDGNNERILKMSDAYNKIFVNSELSADADTTCLNYTLYPNQYLVLREGGHYTKHYFIDGERITSRIGNPNDYESPIGTANGQRGPMEDYIQFNLDEIAMQLGEDIFIEKEIKEEFLDEEDVGLMDLDDEPEPMAYYFSNDQLGSSTYISNADGELVQHLQYAPFGETFVDMRMEDFSTPYRFTGKEKDPETGYYYYGARYYDPRLSRFLSVDPLADTPNNISFSPYSYVANNPIRFTDPTGMTREGVEDDYIVNSSGKIVDIIETDEPHRIVTEDGGILPFNDPVNDPKELENYELGDQLVTFMSESDMNDIMTNAGAGKKEGNLITNSFSKYDFAYSVLSTDYKNEYVIENTDGRRGGRSKFIEVGGFYVFSQENKYNDPRTSYNIHDAGNFLWGQANKRDGHGLTKLLWGANGNELMNFRLRDSAEDQRAIINGHRHK